MVIIAGQEGNILKLKPPKAHTVGVGGEKQTSGACFAQLVHRTMHILVILVDKRKDGFAIKTGSMYIC